MIKRVFRYLPIALMSIVMLASFSTFADTPALRQGKPQTGLPTVSLNVGSHSVRADVANTEATRQIGLMFRPKMAKQDGMLFVFPEVAYHAMWMRNTLIPLSVAYMNERGVIVSIHEMQALSEAVHQAAGPVRYALEMNAGWFGSNKVNVGDTIKGLEKAPKPQ